MLAPTSSFPSRVWTGLIIALIVYVSPPIGYGPASRVELLSSEAIITECCPPYSHFEGVGPYCAAIWLIVWSKACRRTPGAVGLAMPGSENSEFAWPDWVSDASRPRSTVEAPMSFAVPLGKGG